MRISIKNKTYHNKNNSKQVISNFELELNSTGMVFLLGQSGCGKTTLINIISGQDTDFEGSIQDRYSSCHVTQNFELFESMSVIDNLSLVNEDSELINYYLKELEIETLCNQKIHTLSNGEKQRVQFIQALLENKEMLICDEPTTALNIELRYKIMNILRNYAKEHVVFISTHDLTLAQEYADRILEYDQGSFNERSLNSKQELSHKDSHYNRSSLQEWKFAIKYLFSRKMEFISLTLLLLSSLLTLFITLSMFVSISNESEWKTSFKRLSNYIVTDKITTNDNQTSDETSYLHTRYKIDEIRQFIEDSKEIVAVEAFSNYQQYGPIFKNDNSIQFNNEITNESKFFQSAFGYIQHPNGFKERREIMGGPFLMIDDEYEISLQNEEYLNNQVHFFDLVNDNQLPILYGDLPSKGSAVIPLNFAKYLVKLYQLNSVEDLIQQSYDFFVVTFDNIIFLERLTVADYQNMLKGGFVSGGDPDWKYNPNYVSVKISGISSIELPDEYYALFFDEGLMNNVFINHYIANFDEYEADYLNLFVDPKQDINQSLDNLNDRFRSNDCRFYRFVDLYGNGQSSSYQDIYPYFIFLNILILLIFVIYNVYTKNREIKEKRVLMRLNYRKVLFFKSIFIYSMLTILFLLSLVFLTNWINSFAESYRYSAFIKFDWTLLFITLFSIVLSSLVIEKVIHHD